MTELTREQLALCEKYREINVHDSWSECTKEYWAEKLEEYGVNVDRHQIGRLNGIVQYDEPSIYWSGFWSQGDGACFDGRLDMVKFIEHHKLGEDYPAAAFFVRMGEVSCSVKQSGHYYNSGNTTFDLSIFTDYDEPEPVREAIRETMEWQLDNEEFSDFESAIKEICRGYMDDIYEALELEYNYLTSDEVVWESIVANELDHEVEEDEEEIAEPA